MPRVCTICAHPHLREIDASIISGASNRRIAAQYQLSEQSVRRHKAQHLPATLVMAQTSKETLRADDLIAQAQELGNRANRILMAAEQAGDHKTALAAIREARANTELLARMMGQIRPAQVNLSAQASATSVGVSGAGGGVQEPQITRDMATFQEVIASIVERRLTQQVGQGAGPSA